MRILSIFSAVLLWGLCPSATEIVRIMNYTSRKSLVEDYWQEEKPLAKYELEQIHRSRYSKIKKIEQLISPFANKHCLIIVDNPRMVDLDRKSENPFIIRVPVPMLLEIYNKVDLDEIKAIYGTEDTTDFLNITTSDSSDTVYDCRFSNFFFGIEKIQDLYSTDYCFRLDFTKYWKHSRPWNCHVQIGLFPPDFYYTPLQAHNIYKKPYFAFPNNPIPVMRIFVQEIENDSDIQCKLESLFYEEYLYNNILLLVTVDVQENSRLTAPQSVITNIELVKAFPNFKLETLPITFNSLNTPLTIFFTMMLPSDINIIWRFPLFVTGLSADLIVEMVETIQNCGIMTASLEKQKLRPVQKIGRGYALIWLSILGNITIELRRGYNACSVLQLTPGANPQYVTAQLIFSPFIRGLIFHTYSLKHELSKLLFVSCGESGKFSLVPFEELISVFDKWTWILITISLFIVTIELRIYLLSSKTRLFGFYLLSLVKVLLEQGNPFKISTVIHGKLRCALGIFLLAGIVLSNAYKNTNVYNMIRPRRPIPYESFEELFRDNFTVYTRIGSLVVTDDSFSYSSLVI